MVLKGAQWLKIDMNYAPANFCTANTTATQRVQNGQDGCFLLNHDDLALNRTAPYNTSDDVLALMGEWTEQARLHGTVNVSIALCFKYDYGSVCDNSTASQQWRALVQSFYDRAQALITRHDLSLLFVLDGSGSIDPRSPCLTELYGGWPSTYIPYDNSPDAFNSSATPTLARSNLLNIYDPTFIYVAKQHYGKFGPSPYPWLVWEPSDQHSIRNTSHIYLAAGERHWPGLRFAINIDPGQYHITTTHYRHTCRCAGKRVQRTVCVSLLEARVVLVLWLCVQCSGRCTRVESEAMGVDGTRSERSWKDRRPEAHKWCWSTRTATISSYCHRTSRAAAS